MSATETPLDRLEVIDPEHYEKYGYPFEAWARLRREDPVHWIEHADTDPFWAITKHADIIEIGKQPERFLNEPRLAIFTEDIPTGPENEMRHILNMDPPDHAVYRRVTSRQFTPRAVKALQPKVERLTREILDAAAQKSEGDFVLDISAKITIAVIAEMLGVPEQDRDLLFRWTNEVIAPNDPEYQRGATAEETLNRSRMELFEYFSKMVEERRRQPREDMVSVVANGQVRGQGLPILELLSYYLLLVVAGNETTRNAMTGGMVALLNNPGEWKRLVEDPALLDPAVEECIRWTTPVIQFSRTATEDYPLRDKTIREGQSVCLFYPSANRDEEVFEDPDTFRIDRSPNRHIAFGMGEHVCLGAHLARLELREAFGALRERLGHCELAGEPVRMRSSFVGGIKRVPMRWTLR